MDVQFRLRRVADQRFNAMHRKSLQVMYVLSLADEPTARAVSRITLCSRDTTFGVNLHVCGPQPVRCRVLVPPSAPTTCHKRHRRRARGTRQSLPQHPVFPFSKALRLTSIRNILPNLRKLTNLAPTVVRIQPSKDVPATRPLGETKTGKRHTTRHSRARTAPLARRTPRRSRS